MWYIFYNIYLLYMVKFKFYDLNKKKFISPFMGPENIWKLRYKLELWNNSVKDKNLKTMYNLNNKNNDFDLYFKLNNKYVLANNDNIQQFSKLLNQSNKKTNKKLNKKSNKKTTKKNK